MRFALALLSSFLLLNAQIYAISAGPVFGDSGGGSTNTTGTYAGLLIPDDSSEDDSGTNSLGLFTLSVPDTGLGTGQFVVFASGLSFNGTITGFGDPDTGSINGVLDAELDLSNDTFSDGFFIYNFPDGEPNARASGNIQANVNSGGGASFARITGTATVTTQIPQPGSTTSDPNTGTSTQGGTTFKTATFDYTVDGIQQSTIAVPTVSSLGTRTGG